MRCGGILFVAGKRYVSGLFQCANWVSVKLLRKSYIHEKVQYFGPLLGIRMEPGWVTGAAPDVQGKYSEKHQVHSALNPSFVAESRVRSRKMGREINFIKVGTGRKVKGDCLVSFPNSEIFSYSVSLCG